MGKVEKLGGNFAEFIANGVAVVDFYADWCGPCRMLSPIFDEVAEESEGVAFGKINVDEQPQVAKEYKVYNIPNVCIFRDGALVDRVVGLCDASELKEKISSALK